MKTRKTLFVCLPLVLAATSCLPLRPEEAETYKLLQYGKTLVPEEGEAEESCPLHRVPTVLTEVTQRAGLCFVPKKAYVRARVRLFPLSYWDLQSCFCTDPDFATLRKACPVCRETERRWRATRGWPTREDHPLAPGPAM